MGSAYFLNKKFCTSFVLFLYILTCQSVFVARRYAVPLKGNSNETLVPNNLTNYREARRSVASGGIFSIVSFDNVPCQASSDDIGVCYTQRECDNLAGTASGVCAGNYGVCCVILVTGGSTVSINNTYFTNPGYPSPSTGPLSSCISLSKLAGATELYLEFDDFNLLGPTAGLCTNDTFTITMDGVSTPFPTICGNNVGQQEYFDVSQTAGPIQLCINLANTADSRTWKIRIVQFKATDACAAPSGCNQYFQDPSGVVQSYNYNSGEGEFISNICTAYCFTLGSGNCSIMLTENTFMLPGSAPSDCSGDYLLANGQQFCGDTLNNGLLIVNGTTSSSGYIPITVCSSSSNPDMDVGFSLNYAQLPCGSKLG